MQQISHNHDMNQRGIRATTGMAIALIGAITMTVGFSAGSAVAVDVQTIDLNNNDAPDGVDCPDDVNDYWHFVLAPNNDTFSFVSITLNLEGTSTFFGAGQIISNGGQPDNVWVQVPNGYTFTSIMTAGSSADVAPATGTVSFVLSHLCDGAGTTTTTTVAEETTTTVAEETTTTVAEETTTTVAEETTTTVAEETTTTIVAQFPPTTAATTTTLAAGGGATTSLATELPKTGLGDSVDLALLGAVLMLLGGIMLLGTRRPEELV